MNDALHGSCVYSNINVAARIQSAFQITKMNEFLRTPAFDRWFSGVRDLVAKARIVRRLQQAQGGNFGDCEPVGEGVSEMRIHVGAGWRVYFVRRGQTVYLLLCGGDKKTQSKDIEMAKKLAQNLRNEDRS